MKNLLNTTGKMTSLAIAELTGKRHADVINAIRKMQSSWYKIAQRNFALGSYIDKNNQARPMYELSKTECLYIATKFNDEARAKLILRWEALELQKQKPMSPLDMVQASIDAIRANEKDLIEVKQDIKELKAKQTTSPEYYTIVGFAKLNDISVNIKLASRLGRQATKLCKQLALLIDEIPDPRFGRVKMYPKKVLKQVFKSFFCKEHLI